MRTKLFGVITAFALLASATSLQAETLLGIGTDANGIHIDTINPQTGATNLVVPFAPLFNSYIPSSFVASGNSLYTILEIPALGSYLVDINTTSWTSNSSVPLLSGFGALAVSTGGETPLPAALPLFATGLGCLGLLGWRRKRKAQGLAA